MESSELERKSENDLKQMTSMSKFKSQSANNFLSSSSSSDDPKPNLNNQGPQNNQQDYDPGIYKLEEQNFTQQSRLEDIDMSQQNGSEFQSSRTMQQIKFDIKRGNQSDLKNDQQTIEEVSIDNFLGISKNEESAYIQLEQCYQAGPTQSLNHEPIEKEDDLSNLTNTPNINSPNNNGEEDIQFSNFNFSSVTLSNQFDSSNFVKKLSQILFRQKRCGSNLSSEDIEKVLVQFKQEQNNQIPHYDQLKQKLNQKIVNFEKSIEDDFNKIKKEQMIKVFTHFINSCKIEAHMQKMMKIKQVTNLIALILGLILTAWNAKIGLDEGLSWVIVTQLVAFLVMIVTFQLLRSRSQSMGINLSFFIAFVLSTPILQQDQIILEIMQFCTVATILVIRHLEQLQTSHSTSLTILNFLLFTIWTAIVPNEMSRGWSYIGFKSFFSILTFLLTIGGASQVMQSQQDLVTSILLTGERLKQNQDLKDIFNIDIQKDIPISISSNKQRQPYYTSPVINRAKSPKQFPKMQINESQIQAKKKKISFLKQSDSVSNPISTSQNQSISQTNSRSTPSPEIQNRQKTLSPLNFNKKLTNQRRDPSKTTNIHQRKTLLNQWSKHGLAQINQQNNNYKKILFNKICKGSMLVKIEQIITRREQIEQLGNKSIQREIPENQQKKIELKIKVLNISKQFFQQFKVKNEAYVEEELFEYAPSSSMNYQQSKYSEEEHLIEQIQSDNNQGEQAGSNAQLSFRLKSKFQERFNQKIFEPFYITNNTILQYQNLNGSNQGIKQSIVDVLTQHFQQNRQVTKLYFKVKQEQLQEGMLDKSEDSVVQASFKDSKLINFMKKDGNNSADSPVRSNSNIDKFRNPLGLFRQNSERGGTNQGNREQMAIQQDSFKVNFVYQNSSIFAGDSRSNVNAQSQVESLEKCKKVLKYQENEENEEEKKEEPAKKKHDMYSYELKNLLSADSKSSSSSFQSDLVQNEGGQTSEEEDVDKVEEERKSENSSHHLPRRSRLALSLDKLAIEQDQAQWHREVNWHSYLSPRYENYKQRAQVMKEDYDEYRYYEFELIQIENLEDFDEYNNMTFISIKDISPIIKGIQKINDQKYLDAIEANYSHEQMTPLNCIIGNSKIVINRINRQITEIEQNNEPTQIEQFFLNKYQQIKTLVQGVKSSGEILYLYSDNQVQRLKIKRGSFFPMATYQDGPEKFLREIVAPFESEIIQKSLNVYFARKNSFKFDIKMDWRIYQLVAFNIIQNAIKYNKFQGDILVIISCKPIRPIQTDGGQSSDVPYRSSVKKQSTTSKNHDQIVEIRNEVNHNNNYVLETEIIDTGVGITQEKQKLLFIPFMELQMKQNFHQVENFTIGMGLHSSLALTNALGGDLILKKTDKPLTVFGFKIPVFVDESEMDKVSENSQIYDPTSRLEQIYGVKGQMNESLKQYFKQSFNCVHSLDPIYSGNSDYSKGKSNITLGSKRTKSDHSRAASNNESSLNINLSQSYDNARSNSGNKLLQLQKINSNHLMMRQQLDDSIQESDIKKDDQEKKEFSREVEGEVEEEKGEEIESQIIQRELPKKKYKVAKHDSSFFFENFEEQIKGRKSSTGLIANLLLQNNANVIVQQLNNQIRDSESIDVHSENFSSHRDIRVNENKSNLILNDSQSSGLELMQERNNEDQEESKGQIIEEEEKIIEDQLENCQDKDDQDKEDPDNQAISSKIEEEEKNQDALLSKSQSLVAQKNTLIPLSLGSHQKLVFPAQQLIQSENVENNMPQRRCSCLPRILIVDDNIFNIQPLKAMIEDEFNMTTLEAQNGQIAVDMYKIGFKKPCQCKNRTFKLIFMDVQMPVLNGIQATKQILRIQGEEKITNIVFLTSYQDQQTVGSLRQLNVEQIYHKPLDFKNLHRCVWLYFKGKTEQEYEAIQKERFK